MKYCYLCNVVPYPLIEFAITTPDKRIFNFFICHSCWILISGIILEICPNCFEAWCKNRDKRYDQTTIRFSLCPNCRKRR